LALALFFFFYSPPFTDLLPFVMPHHSFSPLPPSARPLLLLTALFLWLWFRTPEKWLLILARLTVALPIVLLLSIPHLPDILLDGMWVIAICVLFLVSPIFLSSFVSPLLTRLNKGKKMLFVISIWLSSVAFMIFVFLLFVRADAIPLSASFALLVSLLVLAAFFYGIRPGFKLKLLMAVCVLLLLTAILQSFLIDKGFQPFVSKDTSMEALKDEERVRKAALITAGPYLQNLQKTSVTVMWETSAPMPGQVIVSRQEEALCFPSENEGQNRGHTPATRSPCSPAAEERRVVHVDGKQLEVKAIDLKGRVFHRFRVDKPRGSTVILE
jgi:hypothetical protein